MFIIPDFAPKQHRTTKCSGVVTPCFLTGKRRMPLQKSPFFLFISLILAPGAYADTETPRPCLTNLPKQEACGASSGADNRPASQYSQLDWFPYAPGTAPGICSGRYIEPASISSDEDTDILDQPIIINAEQGSSSLGQGTKLEGSVDIAQGNRRLQSESATYDQVTGQLELNGGASYREPGLLLRGETAVANTNTLETTLTGAQYVMHERQIRGDVERITRRQDESILIEKGSYTVCPPGDEAWKLQASEIILDKSSGFGLAKHAALRVADVPILYLPYFYFPIDDQRHTGFLYPSISMSNDDGASISTPYYLNLSPQMDDTIVPHYIEKRGFLLENEFRYMNQYTHNTLTTAFLPNDNLEDRDRWLFSFVQPGRWTDKLTSEINYIHVSDNDYLDDLSTLADIDGDSHLSRIGRVTYTEELWQADFLLQGYQTVDEDTDRPYQRLPELTFNGDTDNNERIMNAALIAQATNFYRNNSGFTGIERANGGRLHLEPEIYANFVKPWGYIKPSAKLWYSNYNLTDADDFDSNPSTSVPILSIDSGLVFERNTEFVGTTYKQTLEPRLYALYVPYEEQSGIPDFDTTEYNFNYQSLFRENRYSGYDHIGDTQQVSLGLTTRLFSDLGRETLSASIGQAYFYSDRKVTLDDDESNYSNGDSSDIATAINWRANKRLDLSIDANFDHSAFRNTENNLSLRYRADENRIFNMNYRYAEGIREQSTFGFMWPVDKNWSTLGVWQYDWFNKNDVDLAFGVEYESCCWQTRVIVRNWLKDDDDKDTALYVQFVLKGLGNLGSNGGSSLLEKITGFKQRDDNNETF